MHFNSCLCHGNDTHQRHCTGCKFIRNAYTHKHFYNLHTSMIQLTHKCDTTHPQV